MRGNSVTARPRGSLAAAASACLLTFTSCATPPFQAGLASSEQFAADDLQCRMIADKEAGRAEENAERYEDGGSGEIIGAGLGAMIGASIAEKKAYNDCMTKLGYKK